MVLITGGKYQGKKEFAVNTLKVPEKCIIDNLNDEIVDMVREGKDIDGYIDALPEDAVIIVDEAGCGIIPLDAFEREYREKLGRMTCILSERAGSVYRVVAGLGLKLK